MRHLLTSAICLTVLATSAFADTRLAEIRTHAGQVKEAGEQITLILKAKQPDAQAIRDGMTAMGGDIGHLQRLVAEITAENPQFVQRDNKDWDFLKVKVQLLAMFHNTKDELVNADDMKENRKLLRAHAKGLTARAGMLQETALRLQQ